MMARFCAYIDKRVQFGDLLSTLTDSRLQPRIPTAAVFTTAFTMFITGRGSLNGIDQDRRFPSRLRGIVGPHVPSADTVARVYGLLDPEPLRDMLADVRHQMKRNKLLPTPSDLRFAAVDGHEFFRQPKALLPELPDPHPPSGRTGGHGVLPSRCSMPPGRT